MVVDGGCAMDGRSSRRGDAWRTELPDDYTCSLLFPRASCPIWGFLGPMGLSVCLASAFYVIARSVYGLYVLKLGVFGLGPS